MEFIMKTGMFESETDGPDLTITVILSDENQTLEQFMAFPVYAIRFDNTLQGTAICINSKDMLKIEAEIIKRFYNKHD